MTKLSLKNIKKFLQIFMTTLTNILNIMAFILYTFIFFSNVNAVYLILPILLLLGVIILTYISHMKKSVLMYKFAVLLSILVLLFIAVYSFFLSVQPLDNSNFIVGDPYFFMFLLIGLKPVVINIISLFFIDDDYFTSNPILI